jgi:hypothetical protein
LLFVVCCLLFVVCCLLFVVCCLLFVVGLLFFRCLCSITTSPFGVSIYDVILGYVDVVLFSLFLHDAGPIFPSFLTIIVLFSLCYYCYYFFFYTTTRRFPFGTFKVILCCNNALHEMKRKF